jgi:hypothetical protein
MKSHIRRIEAIEQKTAVMRRTRKRLTEDALGKLSTPDLESLIAAFGADRQRRPLTENQAAARQAFGAALRQECERRCSHAPLPFEMVPDGAAIYCGMIIALAHRFSGEEIKLIRSTMELQGNGSELNERESAALQACNEYLKQLMDGAGVRSCEELERAKRGGPDEAR